MKNNIDIGELKVLQYRLASKVKCSGLVKEYKDVILQAIADVSMPIAVYAKKSKDVIKAEFIGKVAAKAGNELEKLGLNPVKIDKILEVIRHQDIL